MAWFGMVWFGQAGVVSLGESGCCRAWPGVAGGVRSGKVWIVGARCGRYGVAGSGKVLLVGVWYVWVWQEWQGLFRCVLVSCGKAG